MTSTTARLRGATWRGAAAPGAAPAGVCAADGQGRWEKVLSTIHLDWSVRLATDGTRTPSRIWVRSRRLDDLVLVDTGCEPGSGVRQQFRAAWSQGRYIAVMIVRRGRETVAVGDTVTDLGPGDAVIWDSDRAAHFWVHGPLVQQTIIVPKVAWQEVSGGLGAVRAAVLHGAAPTTQLLTGYLDVLFRTVDSLPDAASSAARGAALVLVAAVRQDAGVATGAAMAPSTRAVMEAWIERRLQAGDVTPAAIAAAHAVSVRTVYRVFRTTGDTVGAFVRGRRLTRAREDLTDGTGSISDIAARWGFSDASHFARAFRAQYGCTPRDCRAEAVARPRPGDHPAEHHPGEQHPGEQHPGEQHPGEHRHCWQPSATSWQGGACGRPAG